MTADLILTNGNVITVDGAFRIASALAVKDGRILAIGDHGDMKDLRGPKTRTVDAGGRAVIPGLIDGHAHMDREGLKEALPSLAGATSVEEIVQRIAALAAKTRPGEWIVTMPVGDPPDFMGVPGTLAEKRHPNRHDLDRAAPDNPVYIRSIWGAVASFVSAGIRGQRPRPGHCRHRPRHAAPRPDGDHREGRCRRAHEGVPGQQPLSAGRVHHHESGAPLHAPTAGRGPEAQHGHLQLRRHHQRVSKATASRRKCFRPTRPSMPVARPRCGRSWCSARPWRSVGDADPVELLRTWANWLAGPGLGDSMLRMRGIYAAIAPWRRAGPPGRTAALRGLVRLLLRRLHPPQAGQGPDGGGAAPRHPGGGHHADHPAPLRGSGQSPATERPALAAGGISNILSDARRGRLRPHGPGPDDPTPTVISSRKATRPPNAWDPRPSTPSCRSNPCATRACPINLATDKRAGVPCSSPCGTRWPARNRDGAPVVAPAQPPEPGGRAPLPDQRRRHADLRGGCEGLAEGGNIRRPYPPTRADLSPRDDIPLIEIRTDGGRREHCFRSRECGAGLKGKPQRHREEKYFSYFSVSTSVPLWFTYPSTVDSPAPPHPGSPQSPGSSSCAPPRRTWRGCRRRQRRRRGRR